MDRLALVQRVRALTRDFSNAIFREIDIIDFLNEGIDRISQVIPELDGMSPLLSHTDVPTLLPKKFHHLLPLYATARCFGQDERHYQSSTFMNEFEVKLSDLKALIETGDIVIIDPDTNAPVELDNASNIEYVVTNNYYEPYESSSDLDEGVDGL